MADRADRADIQTDRQTNRQTDRISTYRLDPRKGSSKKNKANLKSSSWSKPPVNRRFVGKRPNLDEEEGEDGWKS